MAQWRKTFYSMGGPERIADPGAEEAARLGALLLQQRAQAEQSALQRQRMDMEQRQYADEGRRADQRMTLEQAARQQQASLAERGFGLDERRIAEQIRSSQAGEQRGVSQDALAAELGRGRLGLEREDLGYRREDMGLRRQQQDRQYDQQDRQFRAGQELTREEIAARERVAATSGQREDANRLLVQELAQRFERQQSDDAYARQRELMGDQLGLEAEGRGRETKRDSSMAGAQAVKEFQRLFPLTVIPDDPDVEEDPATRQLDAAGNPMLGTGTPALYDDRDDVRQLVDLLQQTIGVPTTREEVDAIGQALPPQLDMLFERAAQQQREELFNIPNMEEQAILNAILKRELERMLDAHRARVGETPGPEAPNAPRPRPTPRPAR